MGGLRVIRRHTVEEEESLRRYILSEEDRVKLSSEKWNGGYRWFRSENIVCLENYRRPTEAKPAPRLKVS
jgi:hypothetical protein